MEVGTPIWLSPSERTAKMRISSLYFEILSAQNGRMGQVGKQRDVASSLRAGIVEWDYPTRWSFQNRTVGGRPMLLFEVKNAQTFGVRQDDVILILVEEPTASAHVPHDFTAGNVDRGQPGSSSEEQCLAITRNAMQ